MITIESQLHGYLQGHELLASSTALPKTDQAIIDRLSDIAGPLRAGEKFEPYLSAYPLPSVTHYVLARTWQDLTVQRAGCVRTLSLLIPIDSWVTAESIDSFYDLLRTQDLPSNASQIRFQEPPRYSLRPVENFRGSELLEALFLEDPKPIALIEASDPELIALRLLTALWPSIRRKFALSTYALSPRRIDGRDFDLVFVPKSARSKFADWPGRRVDGQAINVGRHRWTSSLVDRVFIDPYPRLLIDNDLGLVSHQDEDPNTALRITLLWNELIEKLESSPFSLLGLIDIANSRKQVSSRAFLVLKDLLGDVTSLALLTLSTEEAWQFLGAISRKINGTSLATEMNAVAVAAGALTATSPGGAIQLLSEPDPSGAITALLPEIAIGFSKNFNGQTETALLSAPRNALMRLISTGGEWIALALKKPSFIKYFEEILASCSDEELAIIKKNVLPEIVENFQVNVAERIFSTLSKQELFDEVAFLANQNKFSASEFIPILVTRASQLDVTSGLRDQLLLLGESAERDAFVFATLEANTDDLNWLFKVKNLNKKRVKAFLIDLLRTAEPNHVEIVLGHEYLCVAISDLIGQDANDVLLSIFKNGRLPIQSYMDTAMRLIKVVETEGQKEIAFSAIDRGLQERFSEKESDTFSKLFSVVGGVLNGGWIVQEGLSSLLSSDVLSRNFIVFNQAPKAARRAIIDSVDYLAKSIAYRKELDITEDAAYAFATMLFDSRQSNLEALVIAAGHLLPLLFRSTAHPISNVIQATFPIVYQELAEHDSVHDALKFIPFLDWDKCKAARIELVNAFLRSDVWAPEDLLTTACLCCDEEKIIKLVKKFSKGTIYFETLEDSISQVPSQLQDRVLFAFSKIKWD